MILLDTNILSELMRLEPEPLVLEWLNLQPQHSIWTTAVSVFEVRSGLNLMATGKRRSALLEAFEIVRKHVLQERVLSFDFEAAVQSARLDAERRKAGRPGDIRDTMIAGIALATHATLATRNIRHFADLRTPVVDPWTT